MWSAAPDEALPSPWPRGSSPEQPPGFVLPSCAHRHLDHWGWVAFVTSRVLTVLINGEKVTQSTTRIARAVGRRQSIFFCVAVDPGNTHPNGHRVRGAAMTQTERSADPVQDLSPSAHRDADSPLLNQARRMAEQLQTALSALAMIDQAIGILISRGGGSAEEARAALRDVSHSHGTDLGTVARQIVEEVTRRSHARHHEP